MHGRCVAGPARVDSTSLGTRVRAAGARPAAGHTAWKTARSPRQRCIHAPARLAGRAQLGGMRGTRLMMQGEIRNAWLRVQAPGRVHHMCPTGKDQGQGR